ncbi:MAG: beta-lactamase family protein [Hyphomonadaceae bacterium]|nr:beta-lactamase family protein [Hyphomonadaceae bacterium]
MVSTNFTPLTRRQLGLSLSGLALGGCATTSATSQRPLVALRSLRPDAERADEPVRWTLEQRMAALGVPGVSIAIVENGQVVFDRGFGKLRVSDAEVVDGETLFQAASIGKPIAAIGIMREVERGRLPLDVDVNTLMSGFQLPDSPYTRDEKITVRRLLSHTSGLGMHGVPDVARGAPLPSLVEVLTNGGVEGGQPVGVEFVPGSRFQYSGAGYAVLQLIYEEHLAQRERFDEIFCRSVGMVSSTYALAPSNAASGHDSNGAVMDGGWRDISVAFAGGLWSNARDLATLIGRLQRSSARLGASTWRDMRTRQPNSPYGLGFEIVADGPLQRFEHKGGSAGYRSYAVGFAETGHGAVVMANSDSAVPLLFEVVRGIALAYNWPHDFARVLEAVDLSASDRSRLAGAYALDDAPDVIIYLTDRAGRLFIGESAEGEGTPLFVGEAGLLVPQTGPVDVGYSLAGNGPVREIFLRGRSLRAQRTG